MEHVGMAAVEKGNNGCLGIWVLSEILSPLFTEIRLIPHEYCDNKKCLVRGFLLHTSECVWLAEAMASNHFAAHENLCRLPAHRILWFVQNI